MVMLNCFETIDRLEKALESKSTTYAEFETIIEDLSDEEIHEVFVSDKYQHFISDKKVARSDHLKEPTAEELFYADLRKLKIISKSCEKLALAMIRKGRDKDHFYANKIAEHNLRYVLLIAKRYAESTTINPVELVGAGVAGIHLAINKFNPEYGVEFLTFAHHYIVYEISGEVWRLTNSVDIPAKHRRFIKPVSEYIENNKPKSFAEVAAHFGISIDLVKAIYSLTNLVSLNLLIGDDESTQLEDYLPAPDSSTFGRFSAKYVNQLITEAMSKLDTVDRLIIYKHVFDNLSFNDICKLPEIGKSRESVRKKYIEALKKLREYLKSKGFGALEDFFDDDFEGL